MSDHPTSSEAVSQWSGGNPGFLGPAGRMLILTWIHTHRHTDDIYLGRVGIGGVVILHEKGLIKIIWSTSCLIELVIEII